ncbi:MAG: phosphatase PAP2 family protein [Verrucomicrobiota bacterium]|nr:phosphatase PAP2 family protein [Verrucomicrobiota bacterium]
MSARLGWCLALILAALLLAVAFFLDSTVHGWVVQHQTRELRAGALLVSRWGDWPSHIVLGVLGVAAAYFLGDRKWLRIFAAMILACALAGAATRVIKISTGRARPSVTLDAGWNGPRFSSKYHAFPSGHTASSLAFFAVPLFARRRIALLFLPIPLLIASARVLLDAHYLSDVVFAALLGVLCAWLVWRFVTTRYPEPT